MTTSDIKLLTYNPFFGKEILKHFICGYPKKKVSLNQIFLVFPLVFNDGARKILSTANKNSTLESLFLDNSKGKRTLGGIEKRYQLFKDLTQKSILLSYKEESLIIDNEQVIAKKEVDFKNEKDPIIKDFYRAAYYLGVIFSNTNTELEIFLKLRIRDI